MPTTTRTRKPKATTPLMAKDLIGYRGKTPIRIVGARATWTTAKAATRTDNVILIDGKTRKSIAPDTPMEKVFGGKS